MASQLYNQLNQKLTEQMINNLIQSNPKALALVNEMKASGYTPKDFFYKKASEMGVDPNEVFKQIPNDLLKKIM